MPALSASKRFDASNFDSAPNSCTRKSQRALRSASKKLDHNHRETSSDVNCSHQCSYDNSIDIKTNSSKDVSSKNKKKLQMMINNNHEHYVEQDISTNSTGGQTESLLVNCEKRLPQIGEISDNTIRFRATATKLQRQITIFNYLSNNNSRHKQILQHPANHTIKAPLNEDTQLSQIANQQQQQLVPNEAIHLTTTTSTTSKLIKLNSSFLLRNNINWQRLWCSAALREAPAKFFTLLALITILTLVMLTNHNPSIRFHVNPIITAIGQSSHLNESAANSMVLMQSSSANSDDDSNSHIVISEPPLEQPHTQQQQSYHVAHHYDPLPMPTQSQLQLQLLSSLRFGPANLENQQEIHNSRPQQADMESSQVRQDYYQDAIDEQEDEIIDVISVPSNQKRQSAQKQQQAAQDSGQLDTTASHAEAAAIMRRNLQRLQAKAMSIVAPVSKARGLLSLDSSNSIILPQMQQIKSRFNHGCVGGTKCQFFAFCWMSGGSLGASCGLLMTCCVTPSKTEIQPVFYGPVVNDPYCGRSTSKISRIVGGTDASFGQFPWQAFVQVGGSRCGGALISSRHVVTAGHCVARSQHSPSSIKVTLGDYILNSDIESLPHEVFSVVEVLLHPNFRFTPQADRYDVAVLELDRVAQYKDNIKPICLPQKDATFVGRVAYVAGWGALQAGSKLRPKVLQHVAVPVIENNVCESWHRRKGIDIRIYDEMMCAGYELGHRDACQGDSGGPLMLNQFGVWYLVGIVSAGYSCAKQYQPGIYHRVSSSSDWISSNLDRI